MFVDSHVASLGFDNIAFQGVPLVDDGGCPANTLYFINLDRVRLFVHKDRNFTFSGFDSPINQDVETAHVWVAGNFEVQKPSSCGVYQNVSNA